MPSTSTSSSTSSVAATNPALQALFTNLFGGGGGLGTQASSTLGGIMSGQTLQTNTSQLYKTLSQATQPQFQQGQAQIREQAARAGLTDSTSLSGSLGSYTAQYLGNLSNVSTQMGLQEENLQQGVAGNLMSMLASAGSQYYTNKSTTQTSMPWTSGFSSIMGGLASAGTGAAGLALAFA